LERIIDNLCIMQVRLPSMDGQVALVPWADMLNHSCEVCCFPKNI